MALRHLGAGAAAAGVVWMLTMSGALFWYLAPSPNFLGVPTSASVNIQGNSPGSLGDGRRLMLLEATRQFKQSDVAVSQGVTDGTELAPVPFLNLHLEARGAKWRVRSTKGLDAEIFEIS
jgi:hypothetical protein